MYKHTYLPTYIHTYKHKAPPLYIAGAPRRITRGIRTRAVGLRLTKKKKKKQSGVHSKLTTLAAPRGGIVSDRYSFQLKNNYLTEMCSDSEEGSYLMLICFLYHATLGLRTIKKKKKKQSRGHLKLTTHAAPRGGICS